MDGKHSRLAVCFELFVSCCVRGIWGVAQLLAGIGGIQGFPASASRMAVNTAISARIAVFAAATALAARSSCPCTHPSLGRVPDIDAMMSAHILGHFGHTGTTSAPALRGHHDTPSRPLA
jgi:hypothetical protein